MKKFLIDLGQQTYRAVVVVILVLGSAGLSAAMAPSPSGIATYEISTQSDFEALKQLVFNGGDEILLKRGSSFNGFLSLKRSNIRPDEAIRVADFGPANAPRPVIIADVDGMGSVDIRDSGRWVIENLELVNKSEVRSQRYGIYVTAMDSGTHSHFVIRNNFVHDVTGSNDTRDNGGIVFRVYGTATPTTFDDILIEGNEVRNIGGTGIRLKSSWEVDPDDPRDTEAGNPIGRHAMTNLIVRGNRVSNTSRNAIVISGADAPLAEYNVMGPKIATETTGNSFYIFASDDAIVQYNEAFGNVGPASDRDRGGYDADWNSRNMIFRYNYSHDNNFAFSIMRRYIDGAHFHHNISVNDRYGFIRYGFQEHRNISNVIVSNNVFYSNNPDMQMFMNFGDLREPVDTSFIDNIFIFAAGGASWGSEPTPERGNVFENNIVIGLDELGEYGIAVDPQLSDPGAGGTRIDMTAKDRLAGYKLCRGSPLIGAGRTGDNDSEIDFWGDEITSINIGSYGGAGIDCESQSKAEQ